jgi:hypothetical protein
LFGSQLSGNSTGADRGAGMPPDSSAVDSLMRETRLAIRAHRNRDAITEVSDELQLGVSDELVSSVARGWGR